MVYVGSEIGHPLRHCTVAKTVARTNREKKKSLCRTLPIRQTSYCLQHQVLSAP